MIYSLLKGRIGNNLFQVAAGLTLAKKLNQEFKAFVPHIVLPRPDHCTLWEYLDRYKPTIFRNIEFTKEPPENCRTIKEPAYDATDFQKGESYLLDGYFQSERYFDKELIQERYSIPPETEEYLRNKYALALEKNPVSINVRRGDFLDRPHYNPHCSNSFFNNAIKAVGKGESFLVISDDIQWCKKHFTGKNFYFVEGEDAIADLYVQSLCKHNIISNSSFSWWAAWLNRNPERKVIVPADNWVGPLYTDFSYEELIPSSWVRVSNPLSMRNRLLIGKKITERKLLSVVKPNKNKA